VIKPPKNYLKKVTKSRNEVHIPPALLVPTASPYVYISQTALEDEEEEDRIDPTTLFAEVTYNESGVLALPPLFARGEFRYFSPKKDLDYEYPTDGLPEIAFLGRSNVGKSSLINAIMRKNLCLTSRVPGRTQLPYYYGLVPNKAAEQQRRQQPEGSRDKNDPKLAQGFVIDLPGYGYGRAPGNITEDWQRDTQDLLLQRRHEAGVLRRLFLLMDARRGMEGPNEHDRIVMRWLEDAEIPFSVVLTKADRVSVPLVVKQVNDFCLRFASQQHQNRAVAQSPVVHVTSSTRGWGIHELMVSIETEFCAEHDEDDDEFEILE
jgi:GTP-binding protein